MSNSRTITETAPNKGFIHDEDVTIISSYDDMNLSDTLLRGIYAYGWEEPTPIQQRAIAPMISGRDIIAQAQSGTGKTGAFTTAALQIVNPDIRHPQILILSPTRELANQTFNVITALNTYIGLAIVQCVGGTAVRQNIRELQNGAQVVVATPGRCKHMLDGGHLAAEGLQAIILDEADEMLDRGFQETMYECFSFLPEMTQVCLFSATFPQEIKDLATNFMRDNAIRILIKQDAVSLDGIKQFYVNCGEEKYKLEVILDLFECVSVSQTIIFCNSRRSVDILKQQMESRDFTCSSMHGEMENSERQLRMKEFRTGSTRVLIATDILARGIDCDVQMVLNYDMPHRNYPNYIHRIGRSGRRGKKGVAINLLTDSHQDLITLRGLEQHYVTKISELPQDVASLV